MSMRKIAKIAGLSHAAVSLALRGSPKISRATRAKVHRIARRLGYQPDFKVREVMTQLSLSRGAAFRSCFGVISLYDTERPWEQSLHLNRMFEGMRERAETLGYRLDPLWMRAPGMTLRRFRGILETRGIEGLLCFGSPDFGAELPPELDRYAIVTQGLSIATPLHRVINHAYLDTWRALDRVQAMGYRRPGLVLARYEDERSGHANASAYLGWCEARQGAEGGIPILRVDQLDARLLRTWVRANRPDVLVFIHNYPMLGPFHAALRAARIRVPQDLAVVAISQVVRGSGFSGIEENQRLMGVWAVELLASRIAISDFGIPVQPRIEPVTGVWIDGETLPPKR